jgi:hypothetical protein
MKKYISYKCLNCGSKTTGSLTGIKDGTRCEKCHGGPMVPDGYIYIGMDLATCPDSSSVVRQ